MQTSTLETTLTSLRGDLEDVKTRNSQTGCVYMAYKMHTLSSGIYTLENLRVESRSENQEIVNTLLMQYRQEYQNIFNQ
jgi:hypothetical protein